MNGITQITGAVRTHGKELLVPVALVSTLIAFVWSLASDRAVLVAADALQMQQIAIHQSRLADIEEEQVAMRESMLRLETKHDSALEAIRVDLRYLRESMMRLEQRFEYQTPKREP
jgi:hypothetical protein